MTESVRVPIQLRDKLIDSHSLTLWKLLQIALIDIALSHVNMRLFMMMFGLKFHPVAVLECTFDPRQFLLPTMNPKGYISKTSL